MTMTEALDYYIIFGAAVRADGSPSATLRRRVEGAHAMAQDNAKAAFLVTGGKGDHGPSEAAVMRRLLIDLGVPADRILIEDKARDTLDSAVLCSRILSGRNDVRKVTACSSRYHVDRCRILLRMVGTPASMGAIGSDRRRIGTLRWLYHWTRDLAALPLDLILIQMPYRRAMAVRRPAPSQVDSETLSKT